MPHDASELARRLAREAEAVCRHYLSNGKREGRYWLVGDVHNTPGRSLFVRLQDSPKGPAGKWTDAATSEHGDLLDIIRQSLGLRDFREVAEEARRFLNLPRTEPQPVSKPVRPRVAIGSQEAARRLFAISGPIEGTIVETYLRHRGIAHVYHGSNLRFQPRCYYRPDEHLPTETWPAMIACVTNLDGSVTPFVLALRTTTYSLPAKASRQCCRYAVSFRPCRWHQPFRPITSPPCRFRRACVVSISLAMLTPPETRCKRFSRSARNPPASRPSRCRPGQATSTKICTSSVSTPSVQPCGYSSYLRTSTASSCRRQHSDSYVCLPSMFLVRSRRIQCRQRPRPRPSRGRSDGKRPGPAMAEGRLFSAARRRRDTHIIYGVMARFASRSKIAAPCHPPLALRPSAAAPGSAPFRLPSG